MPRSKRRREHLANYRFLVAREARELLPVVGYPGRPIAGRPGRPIAGYPGYGGGYYRPGWGYGAAAVGAAAAAGAYGYYNNNYNSGCYYDTYGSYVCPGQYPYQY